MTGLSSGLLAGLLDDAAAFPPGSAPLDRAVVEHAAHLRSPYADAVGPLVVRAADLGSSALAGTRPRSLAVVTGVDQAHAAITAAGPRLRMLEVALPDSAAPDEVRSLASFGIDVFVEVPRDGRRHAVLEEIAAAGLKAKFRTGGLAADLYPSPAELAASLHAAVTLGVAFKATAGLHHAVRHTDPKRAFDEHGFLNLLVATALAQSGASVDDLEQALAWRDEAAVAAAARHLAAGVRDAFCSFGTCSITDPLEELARLDLLPLAWTGVSA